MKKAMFAFCLIPLLTMPAFADSLNTGDKPMVVAEGVEIGVGGVGVGIGDRHWHHDHAIERGHRHYHHDVRR